MANSSNFKSIFKNIEKAVTTSQRQAISRAVNSTRSEFASNAAEELGIPVKRVKARALGIKGKDFGTLSIGVRNELAAQEFKPGQVAVSSSRGKRYAATYKIKGNKNVLSNGAFLAATNNANATKKLILQRVGDSRYPTKTVLINVFRPVVEKLVPSLTQYMRDEYEKNFRANLSFNLSKKR